MKNKEDVLNLMPMKDYKAPELPTYEENKPDLTKKFPLRWKNKAIIAATIGIVSAGALAKCTFERHTSTLAPDICGERGYLRNFRDFEYDLCIRVHHGGFGGAPVYVAHLTEQEVLGIISARLEEVGLIFGDEPPSHWIDLFDANYNVGIVQLNIIEVLSRTRLVFDGIAKEHNITIGEFIPPSRLLENDFGMRIRLNARRAAEIRPALLENLNEQIQEFI